MTRLPDKINVRELQASILRDSYFEFFKYFWDEVSAEDLILAPHIEVIANELQTVAQRVFQRLPKEYDLIINVPPGSSKSTLTSVLWEVWCWINDPTVVFITGSHTTRLAIGHATKSRDVIKSEKFKAIFNDDYWKAYFPDGPAEGFQLRPDIDNKTNYKNNFGGERIVTSSGTSIIGSHAHIVSVDDPIDPEGSKSIPIMERINRWMDGALPTRKVDKAMAPTVLTMQRLHENDQSGNWIKKLKKGKKRVKLICLPATDDYEVHPPELRSIYKNGLLDPIRMSREILADLQNDLGPIEYAGQFGQSPRVLDGNIIKKTHLPVLPRHKIPAAVFEQVAHFYVDSSDKIKKENDPTGIIAVTYYKNYLFVLGYLEIKQVFANRIQTIEQFIALHGSAQSLTSVEPKSSGVAMVQYMKQYVPINVVEYKMMAGDKMQKLQALTSFFYAQRIVCVDGPGIEKFASDITGFPNAVNDEAVDCVTMAATDAFLRPQTGGYRYYG